MGINGDADDDDDDDVCRVPPAYLALQVVKAEMLGINDDCDDDDDVYVCRVPPAYLALQVVRAPWDRRVSKDHTDLLVFLVLTLRG